MAKARLKRELVCAGWSGRNGEVEYEARRLSSTRDCATGETLLRLVRYLSLITLV